jgi:hypothetical protein
MAMGVMFEDAFPRGRKGIARVGTVVARANGTSVDPNKNFRTAHLFDTLRFQ